MNYSGTVRNNAVRIAMLAALLMFGLAGCDRNEGPVEEAAEQVDESMEETGDKFDEAIEETADAVEEAADEVEEKAD
jgi:predicted small lipoprotein YifL